MKRTLAGVPVGLALGALIAFVLFRAVEAQRADTAPPASANAAAIVAAATAETEALTRDVTGLDTERVKLEVEIRALDGQIAAARGAKGASKPVVTKTFKNPWSPMAKKLFLLKDKLDEIQNENSDEYRDLMLQFMEIAKELMEEEGFDLSEFEMSPYGSPMLMLAVLEGAEPPVDPAVLLKAQADVAKADAAWKAMQGKKEAMSALEWRRAGAGIVWGAMQDIRGGLTPEQLGWFSKGRMWSDDSVRVSTWPLQGKRPEVEAQLLGELARTLKMEGADAPLRPVVNDFLRQYGEMEAAWKAKESAGQPLSAVDKALARADLAIQLEQGIRATVNLTDEQQKALKSLGHAWEVTLTGE